MPNYEFDARRYCFNNHDRMGHRPDGTPIAVLIICEIDSMNVRIEALKSEVRVLKSAARALLSDLDSHATGSMGDTQDALAALVGEEKIA